LKYVEVKAPAEAVWYLLRTFLDCRADLAIAGASGSEAGRGKDGIHHISLFYHWILVGNFRASFAFVGFQLFSDLTMWRQTSLLCYVALRSLLAWVCQTLPGRD
jgi:hypothetical protein